jgi:Cu/Ag efflux protein CusF
MRNILIPAVATVFLATSIGAFAADAMASGAIKSIDEKAMTITLEGGAVYKLPAGFKLADLKVGEKVNVSWVMKGTEHDATKVEKAM